MQATVESQLADMENSHVSELHARFVELFHEQPRSRNRHWLIRKIAWRLQSLAEGGLTDRARQRAAELAAGAEVRSMPPRGIEREPTRTIVEGSVRKPTGQSDARLPSEGTSLTREYKGRQIEVRVVENGFEYAGDRYKSLSAIAKVITGSHCNGFRFFRLENR